MFLAAILSFGISPVLAATPTCYYSDKSTIAEYDTPCNSSASISSCCTDTDFCLDNGLCLSYYNLIYQGSCTDREWRPGCQAFSSGPEMALFSFCGSSDDDGATLLSCGWDVDCSNNFTLPYMNGIVLRVDQAGAAGFSKPLVVYSDPSLEESNTTETSTADSTSTHPTNTHEPPATMGTPSSAKRDEVRSFTAKDMAAVGAGVGIPLAMALVVAIALLYREKKSKRYATQPPSGPTINPLPWQIHSPISPDDFGSSTKPGAAHETMSGTSERQELGTETVQKRADGPNFTIEA